MLERALWNPRLICNPENEITGEALIALRHEELKEMGVISIGHRLTILKGVYDVKQKQGIPLDSDHWVPPCESMVILVKEHVH